MPDLPFKSDTLPLAEMSKWPLQASLYPLDSSEKPLIRIADQMIESRAMNDSPHLQTTRGATSQHGYQRSLLTHLPTEATCYVRREGRRRATPTFLDCHRVCLYHIVQATYLSKISSSV